MDSTEPTATVDRQYRIIERVHDSGDIEVFRARRVPSGQSVVLKVLKPEAAEPRKVARLKQEFDLVSRLALPGVAKAYAWDRYQTGWMMVLEDIGGASLEDHLRAHKLELGDFLRLATRAAESLDEIHQHGVTHRSIQPAHIIWNPETGAVRITGFGLASALPEQTQGIESPPSLGRSPTCPRNRRVG